MSSQEDSEEARSRDERRGFTWRIISGPSYPLQDVPTTSNPNSTSSTLLPYLDLATALSRVQQSVTEEENYAEQMLGRSRALIILDKNLWVEIDYYEFAQISGYFQAAFYGNFKERTSKILVFDKDKSRQFLSCCILLEKILKDESDKPDLRWMDLEQALEMLDIASYLMIDLLLMHLSDVIIDKINANSLVATYHTTENRYVPLAQKLWKLIVRHFDCLLLNDTFLQLNEDEIRKLLCDKHLNIDKNDETFMIQRWIKIHKHDRESVVRLSSEFIHHTMIQKRLPNTLLLACGGWCNGGATNMVEIYNYRANCWINSNVKLFPEPRAYHGMVSIGDDIYTIGGFNSAEFFRSNVKFNVKSLKYSEIAPMYDQRCYVGCCAIDTDRIIAIGGRNSFDRLKTAEILSISTNQWHRIAEMNFKRSDGQCLAVNGTVFAIGGFNGVHCNSSVEYYDPQSDRWLIMGNHMIAPRSGVSGIIVEGAIILCGGFNGYHRLQTCEFMDVREGRWYPLRPMNIQRSNFGMEVVDNRIIAAGGYAGPIGIIRECEAYEIRFNSWINIPRISRNRSALCMARVENQDIIPTLLRPKRKI